MQLAFQCTETKDKSSIGQVVVNAMKKNNLRWGKKGVEEMMNEASMGREVRIVEVSL